ncbi:MAG: DUF692 domain-containing protein [bacterium]|nr:DUF692 domain-containing protein [bacterium]
MKAAAVTRRKINGAGIGLRPVHIPYVLERRPAVAWFEILIDNYLYGDVRDSVRVLANLRADYPMCFHAVGLDVGSVDPIDAKLLDALNQRRRELEPDFVSTHLCWTANGGVSHHDLLPLPFTQEAVRHCAERIGRFQDALGERILIENISTYLRFAPAAAPATNEEAESQEQEATAFMREGKFIAAVAEAADCYVLLDLNNLHINHHNHGDAPEDLDAFFETIPAGRVRQYHLAGYEDRGTHLLDTHGAPVSSTVWKLFERAVKTWGPQPACIERDTDIPPDFSELMREAETAGDYLKRCD